jgi:glycerate dehydrogenase
MKIVLLDKKTLANTSVEYFKKFGTLETFDNTSLENIVQRAKSADIVITNKVVLSECTLKQLPHLKLICIAATGTNNVDLNAAKTLNIAVTNATGYSTASVVQHTFTMIGNLYSNMMRYACDTKDGHWQRSDIFCRLDYPISEISNKNFVIFGYGTLGRAVAKVAHAFGAKVIVAERPYSDDVRPDRVAFFDAIKSADILSIHSPLTDETKDLFNAQTLSLMKPSAILINTARGQIVNETALIDALTDKTLAGAGFDVLSQEPANHDNPLMHYKGHNLIVTPHTAWASQESIERLILTIGENINAFLNNKDLNRVV